MGSAFSALKTGWSAPGLRCSRLPRRLLPFVGFQVEPAGDEPGVDLGGQVLEHRLGPRVDLSLDRRFQPEGLGILSRELENESAARRRGDAGGGACKRSKLARNH